MDISIFVRSLSREELKELRKLLSMQPDGIFPPKPCIKFISENEFMSSRLVNALLQTPNRDVFDYLNAKEFTKLRGGGKKSHSELMTLLIPTYIINANY